MAVVASATGVALGMTAGTIGAGLVGGAVLGAGIGGLYSAFTGDGNILNSMLTGGLIGGAAGGIGAAFAPAATAAEAATAAGATGAGTVGPAATVVSTPTAALTSANTAGLNAAAANAGVFAEGAASLPGAGLTVAPEVVTPAMIEAGKSAAVKTAAGLTGKEMLGYGLAGTTAMQLLGGRNPKGAIAPASATDPGNIRPYEFSPNQTAANGTYPSPYAKSTYDAAGMPIMDTRERNYFDQKFTALTPYSARAGTPDPNKAANGGLMAVGGPVQQMSQNVMGGQGNMFPQSQQEHTNFATPTQMPTSAEVIRSDYDTKTSPYTGVMMASGGLSDIGYQGYGKQEEKPVRQENPVGEYLVNQIFNPPSQSSVNVAGGSSGTESSSSSSNLETNPILRAMYDKQVQNPDHQFTQQELVGGWQAYNPNALGYNANTQKYTAATPDEQQLSSFKQQMADYMAQDRARKAKEQEQQQQQTSQDFNGANGGLMSMAMGGMTQYNLGGYSDGGRLLKGPGDGVSDDIPATIAGKQPARLADGEFVIPARIVSELGNGSTDAGAKRLYAMMDKIQAGRKKTIGKNNVAKDTKAKKHLLA
jgi:hypothetical protein